MPASGFRPLLGTGGGPDILQCEHTQLVRLDFNGLITVAMLRMN